MANAQVIDAFAIEDTNWTARVNFASHRAIHLAKKEIALLQTNALAIEAMI